MSPVVRDCRVSHAAFTGGTDGRNAVIGAEPRAQPLFGRAARLASHVIGRFEPDLPVVNDEHRQRRGPPDEDEGVAAGTLAGEREAAAGQRVVEASRQRAATDDGEFRGGGERTTDERAERKDQRGGRRERISGGPTFVQKQPRPEAAAADALAQ